MFPAPAQASTRVRMAGALLRDGTIMGNYLDADNLSHGFLRNRDGTFTTFDAPGAGHVPGSDDGTYPFGINTNGAITGWYVDDARCESRLCAR